MGDGASGRVPLASLGSVWEREAALFVCHPSRALQAGGPGRLQVKHQGHRLLSLALFPGSLLAWPVLFSLSVLAEEGE